MNKLAKYVLVLAASSVSAFAVNTYNIFTDATGVIQFYQPDGNTKFNGTYVFEAGVYSGSNFSAAAISSGFISLGFTANWDPSLLDTNVGGASISLDFDGSYPVGVTAGNQIYLWAYDTKSLTAQSDWVVITNPNWLVSPLALGAAVEARDYTITDPGTVYVFGSLVGNRVITALAAGAPIPEPSTAAALGGLIALGAVATRRRRAA